MAHVRRDLRLVAVPPEIRERVTFLVREHGPLNAAKLLGVSRDLAVRVTAGLEVMPGSMALLREAMGRIAA
ncbi:MAG: hypothetical protein ABI548_04605 [Polyangiaceae bacterium]